MADEKKLAFLVVARDLASKEFKSINGEIAKMEKTTKGAKTGLGGLLSTVNPMKVGLFGAAAAATALVGAGIKVTEMAAEEEKNVARLNTSLKANVLGWDGNTAAIEKAVFARESLGFADDALRDSLAKLVGSTHDVTKAQDLQRTAMDLARFAGIDLVTASDALIKVENGQFRALKGLGIKLKDFATTQDAVAAVQAVAKGQAQAYANTLSGKLETAQIRVNDAMEDFGAVILPMVADALSLVTGNQSELFGIGESIADEMAIANVGALRQTKAALEQGIQDLQSGWQDFFTVDQQNYLKGQLTAVNLALSSPFSVAQTRAAASFAEAKPELGAAVRSWANEIPYGITEAGQAALREARRIPEGVAAGIRERRDAPLDAMTELRELMKHQMAPSVELARLQGQLTSAELAAGLKSSDPVVRAQAEETKQIILDRMDELHAGAKEKARLAGEAASRAFVAGWGNPNLHFEMTTGLAGYYQSEHRASGGPVLPGHTYDVGEVGREKLIMFPGGGGQVIPMSGSRVGGGGSGSPSGRSLGSSRGVGGGLTVNFNSTWPPTLLQAREIVDFLEAEMDIRAQLGPGVTIGQQPG